MNLNLKEDFYHYVNGEWIESAVIPADKPSTGGFQDLVSEIEKLLMKTFAEWAANPETVTDAHLQHAVAYYQLATDFAERDQLAGEPVAPLLARIKAIDSFQELNEQLGDWILDGFPLPFDFGVMADMKHTTTHAVYLSPTSLILPDKTYYAEDNEQADTMLQKFFETSSLLLQKLGHTRPEAETLVEQAMAFDRSLVPFVKSAEENADYSLMYNPRSYEEVIAYSDTIDFDKAFAAVLPTKPEQIIVSEPTFFESFKEFVTQEQFPLLKSWLYVMTSLQYTDYLSDDIRVLGGEYGRFLSGIQAAKEPVKAAYTLAFNQFSAPIGVYYGQKYFGPKAKQNVEHMVQAMVDVYKNRLETNTWLSEATRKQAVVKLNKIGIHVGYPESIPAVYDHYQTVAKEDGGSFFSNTLHFKRLAREDNFNKLTKPVDRKEWGMSAATVNAYYSGLMNIIVFPAAILQAPFYSLTQSSSANYGGIGAVIAHEISHAFDNNGAKFDENGNLHNWWTAEDLAQFQLLAQAMIDEFDGIEFAGAKVNGKLTVSENIADAGGLSCALEAAKAEPDVQLADFFTNWAKIWRTKATTQYQQLLLNVDVHGPAKLRANIQLQNLDDFYTTFDIQPGDAMYREPENRVHIW